MFAEDLQPNEHVQIDEVDNKEVPSGIVGVHQHYSLDDRPKGNQPALCARPCMQPSKSQVTILLRILVLFIGRCVYRPYKCDRLHISICNFASKHEKKLSEQDTAWVHVTPDNHAVVPRHAIEQRCTAQEVCARRPDHDGVEFSFDEPTFDDLQIRIC